jgi:CPA2 family monovalent cation:H+ antiporter-2
VVLRHLKQQQQIFEPFGRLVTSVLLLQDLLMIAMILVVSRLLDGTAVMMQSIGLTVLLVGLAVVLQRWWVPLLVSRLKLDEETFLLCILAVLFAFIGTAFYLSLPFVVGAFCAGFAFSTFPVNGLVRGLVSSLSDFFMAVFFLALGAFVILPSPEYLLSGLILVLLMILVTPPLVTCIAEWTGLSSRASIESGLLLAQMSEYSLVLGLIGLLAGHINLEMFSTLALMVVLTMTVTPLLATDRVTRRLLHLHPLRRRAKADAQFQDHVLVLGFGAGGMWVVKPLIKEGYQILVVDDDPVVIEQLRKNNIPCIRGDGSDEKNLEKSGARRAKLIIASMRRVQDAEKVIRYARGVPVIVRVLETTEAEHVKSLGGIPILNSEAAADTFLEWYEKSGRVQTAAPAVQ